MTLDALARNAPRPSARSLPVVPSSGGRSEDPSRPCDSCSKRRTCEAPCERLSSLLGPEEIRAWDEVSSPALMEGRGYDPQFMVQPEALREEEHNDPRRERLAQNRRTDLFAAIPGLTTVQREVVEHLLEGKTRTDIRRLRGVSRQAIHKDYHAALRYLRKELGVVKGKRTSGHCSRTQPTPEPPPEVPTLPELAMKYPATDDDTVPSCLLTPPDALGAEAPVDAPPLPAQRPLAARQIRRPRWRGPRWDLSVDLEDPS